MRACGPFLLLQHLLRKIVHFQLHQISYFHRRRWDALVTSHGLQVSMGAIARGSAPRGRRMKPSPLAYVDRGVFHDHDHGLALDSDLRPARDLDVVLVSKQIVPL
ncbi:hypothetical protein EVAR_95643_1 [Eumeta japonica]|uniref:Uncharacterized protein n=1 Tax=Eumeta variegata TaxID=151549 RepID=A0A4C2AFC6_EUMVA|nr:hypothetical protein EVAR_95643_1 [Eumeta japonica]